jgi:multidrug resistance protein, MATE family
MTEGEAILHLFGQSDDLARGGGRALGMFAWGMPAIYGYVATAMFLEGIGRTRPGMFVMIGANVVNVALNWVLIYGNLGFRADGAAGAVLATSITRWVMLAALLAYVFTMADRDRYGLFHRIERPWRLQIRFLRLGAPMALSYAAETTAFMTITMMAGIMGAMQVAAFQATMNVVAFCFMVAIGMATATSVRVGNAVGRRDPKGLRMAGWTGAGLITVAMVLLAAAVVVWQAPIAAIYTSDSGVQGLILAGLAVVAFLLVADGWQAVLVGALRGAADVWPTTIIGFLAFWAVMVPCAWLLGPHLGGGVAGLIWAEVIGATVAAALLAVRFHVVSRRAIAPV